MSRWYRAYEGTTADPKLHEAAVVAECSRSVVIAVWSTLLESCAHVGGSFFETTPRRIAVILGEPVSVIEAVVGALEELSMIQDGEVLAWKKRQFESDSSTERSRKHRESVRQRSENVAETPLKEDATSKETDATVMQRCATPPDTETEYRNNTTPLTPQAGGGVGVVVQDELFNPIRDAFLSKNPTGFRDVPRETLAIRKLCDLIRGTARDSPVNPMASSLIQEFWKATSDPRDQFFGKHPFLPSKMVSLWDYLLKRKSVGGSVSDLSAFEGVL